LSRSMGGFLPFFFFFVFLGSSLLQTQKDGAEFEIPSVSIDSDVSIAAICTFHNNRPPIRDRLFFSPKIDAFAEELCLRLNDKELALLFIDCFPNTLDTTVLTSGEEDTFIITGDIHAMWLRDSSWQVDPYVHFANDDPKVATMLRGLIRRHTRSVLLDVYANAFTQYSNDTSPWSSDARTPPMGPGVYEGKYEVDSLCSVIRTAFNYWNVTGDSSVFDDDWVNAMTLILDTFQYQQQSTEEEMCDSPQYQFQRETLEPTDTLSHSLGSPASRTGMIKSAFRGSDDATTFQFNIPENAFAVVSLHQLHQLFLVIQKESLAERAKTMAEEIEAGIRRHGVVMDKIGGEVYAYEIDGFGNYYLMDDANIPSLLALPYIGYTSITDPLYVRTRGAVLAGRNPFYFSGTDGVGIGGPHVGIGYIWPMSIITRAQTTNDENEIRDSLNLLKSSSVGTGFMHESFWRNNATDYTRPWFAWANTMFGNLIVTLSKTHPDLIFNTSSSIAPGK